MSYHGIWHAAYALCWTWKGIGVSYLVQSAIVSVIDPTLRYVATKFPKLQVQAVELDEQWAGGSVGFWRLGS